MYEHWLTRVFEFCYLRNILLLFWGLINTTWVQYIYSCLSVLLNSVNFINTGQKQKGFVLKGIDFHSFLLEFIKWSVQGMIRILWFVHWPHNIWLQYKFTFFSCQSNTEEDSGGPWIWKIFGETRMPQQAATKFKMAVLVQRSRSHGHWLWCQ